VPGKKVERAFSGYGLSVSRGAVIKRQPFASRQSKVVHRKGFTAFRFCKAHFRDCPENIHDP
jgi:hypothetical protein